MLMRNNSLKYFSISDLHRFNTHAVDNLVDSLLANEGLKMIDFRQTSREFFEFITESVNRRRSGAKGQLISFKRDEQFVLRKT